MTARQEQEGKPQAPPVEKDTWLGIQNEVASYFANPKITDQAKSQVAGIIRGAIRTPPEKSGQPVRPITPPRGS